MVTACQVLDEPGRCPECKSVSRIFVGSACYSCWRSLHPGETTRRDRTPPPVVPVDAFIHETKHPDCDPAMRFRAVLPSGMCAWFGTRGEARAAIRKEVG